MLNDKDLKRLNELAKLKREGLITQVQKDELSDLRQQYLNNFRASFKQQIENTKVIDPNGNDVTPEKVKSIQNKKDRQ